MIRTRFAPSPTGDLHVGGAWTALASWVLARRAGGTFVIRNEDIDTPRVVAGSIDRIAEDLAWLGLDWDGAITRQSDRLAIYDEALAALDARGLLYRCDCSRAEIARVASAPHAGEDLVYPGTCRDLASRVYKREPAIRFRVPARRAIAFHDEVMGDVIQRVDREVGDFVLRRADGVYAYQFVVIVDDLAMGITDVVRGVDLLASTPRQMLLAESLGAASPRYTHVPLVVAGDGSRLAKRTAGATIRELRTKGISAEEIIGALSAGLGLTPSSAPTSARDLVRRPGPIRWTRASWPIPDAWSAKS